MAPVPVSAISATTKADYQYWSGDAVTLDIDPGFTASWSSCASEHSVSYPVPFKNVLYCLNEQVLVSVVCNQEP